jgi:hypothetical protein
VNIAAPVYTSNTRKLKGANVTPFKQRGLYFNQSDSALEHDYTENGDKYFYLHHTFSFSAWVRPTIGADMAIFSSCARTNNADAATNNPWLTFGMNAAGKYTLTIRKFGGASVDTYTSTLGFNDTSKDWQYAGFSLKLLETDTHKSTYRFYLNAGSGSGSDTDTASNTDYFIQVTTTPRVFVGASLTNNVVSSVFKGFIYVVYIDKSFQTTNADFAHNAAGSCNAACTGTSAKCTETDTECLLNRDFDD